MNHPKRLRDLAVKLTKLRLDYLLVSHLPNIHYLCGFTGSAGALLVDAKNTATFFTDGRYTEQAREQVQGAKVVVDAISPTAAASKFLAKRRQPARIGIESTHLTVALERRLKSLLPKAHKIVPTSDLVEALRSIKDSLEIGLLRKAVNLGSSLFDNLAESVRPGVPEATVAAKLQYAARLAGAEGMSFDTIVAAGTRSALPHGRASATPIPRRGFVVLDYGVILSGYCSDMTRTVFVGRSSPEERRWYSAVLEAQLAGIAAVRAGVSAGEVDAAARKVLQRNKLGKYFTHSTGHGVGLEIHESPRLAAGEKAVLAAGMVVTIEPGIYVTGKGGVRIEDMVLVTDSGCEVLTPTRKELITI